jgi:hypothetical protein
MMKIVCQICGVEGYLQHISRNYYRVRHYVAFKNGKPVFKYHRQDPEYIQTLLEQERIDQVDHTNIDQKLFNNASSNENVRGPVVQFGMNAAFARRRPRVQIPPGPPLLRCGTFITFRV